MKNTIFLQTINQFLVEEVMDKKQITNFQTDGKDLEIICEEYYKRKLDQSGLKHFYMGKKIEYIALGFSICAVIMCTLYYLMFF